MKALLGIVIVCCVLAQEPIRVTTRLIETNVIVRDSHGPVADLTQDAFKIFDDGKEQRIAVFRLTKPAPISARAATSALPPGVVANRVGTAARPLNYTALVIDTLNTEIPDQIYVRTQLLSMLGSMTIRDPIAIYVLGQKFRVLQDFTLDAKLLLKAVDAFRPEQSQKLRMAYTPTPLMLGGSAKTAQLAAESFGAIRAFGNQDRAMATIDSIEQLGRYLQSFPGKKSLIWISNAFPPNALRNQPDLMRNLNRADVTIHAVHARGLVVFLTPGINAEMDGLKWIADQTGGRAFYDRNDIGVAIQEAMQDGEVSYTLGFYSQHEKADGSFHIVKVKVDRPGVDVRHREGYFDIEPKTVPPNSGTLLERAARVPESASAIGLVGAIARDGAKYQVAVQIDFNDLRLESANGRWKGSAELAFLALSREGRVLDWTSKSLNFDMTDEAYRARLKEGFALEQTIPARMGISKIRIVVVDRAGSAGSVTLDPASLPSK